MQAGSLREQADLFAEQLTRSVRAVAPSTPAFVAIAAGERTMQRFAVRQDPDTGIPLKVGDAVLLTLKALYLCVWDGQQQFLAVDRSHIQVFPGPMASREPLFRSDYVRDPGKDHPGAHLQVHAHRDGIAHVMTLAGRSTKRAQRRAASDRVPRMDELHFPLGGSRFRPCLEDVLEMLVSELRVDCSDEGRDVIRQEREQWRRHQVATAARDAPYDAARALRALGFSVLDPESAADENLSRLREH